MTGEDFYDRYAVADPAQAAAKCRNPRTAQLRAFAEAKGRQLASNCGIAGAEYVIGGSLGYDAVLEGSFDIDLRLLVPDAGKPAEEVRREIDAVQQLLVDDARAEGGEIKCKFIDENGTNYIRHTKRIVRLPGTEQEVELTWNIQSKSSYKGIAGLSARLPGLVRDRYVVAKAATEAESKDAYAALKTHWRDFISWLYDKGAGAMSDPELEKLLCSTAAIDRFPLFLKAK